ncbi:PilN domain-containing protein [Pulveribacter suum]|uniref:Fimbrial assembly protein n=1 Tax=Pulveribacter suum TaxID=2116657 RepID=A0A2P1NP69_9BURK|nr:PilN domain-containing protein [Pulveribacter suum]AVP58855.1 fimbrial assembly protein [Pulveribacter suum]
MPLITADARFLGIDIRAGMRELRQAWAHAQRVAPLSWLTPDIPVMLLHADGGQSWWRGLVRSAGAGNPPKPACVALELPEDLLLRRTLVLPAMSEVDASSAVALQVQAMSPFPGPDLVWGCSIQSGTDGTRQVDLALASRGQVAQYLEAQAPRLGTHATPEVWAVGADYPIVFAGYGESVRHARERRGRHIRYALLALAVVLASALALTPTLQLRARALQAVGAYDDLARRTAAPVRERERLMHSVEKLDVLSEMLAGRIEPLRVIDRLTKVLPDDTALQGLTLKGQKVTIHGLTANASSLMRSLGEQPGVRDVHAPSPAMRVGGPESKENFVIEFTLDPQEFGVVSIPAVQAASAPQAVVPAAAPTAPPSAASLPAPATAPAPAAAPATGRLVPSFGGGSQRPLPSAPPSSASGNKTP